MTTLPQATPACRQASSLVQLLELQAEARPSATAFRFCREDGQEDCLTFSQLRTRARAIGARLSEELQPGDRALLVYPPGLEFIASFFGCLNAGVVATPATYPKPRRPLPRMSRIAEDSGAKVALTTAQTLSTIDLEQQDAAARSLHWLATNDLTQDNPDWRPHPASPQDLAFLQYTSGSTSEPKGVMVSHGNLLANLEAIRVAFGLPESPAENDPNAGVFWLPAYHDMGLIGGVLTPLYVGGPSILMPPTSFLQRPLRWLETIHRNRATISGAPDFAYRLCVQRTSPEQRADLDLSTWRLAFCGAEPIHADTLIDFAEAMEPTGFNPAAFYPCYGLAEATLLAAGPDWRQPPTLLSVDRAELGAGRAFAAREGRPSQKLVGCGRAPKGHEVLIVDPQPSQTGAFSARPDREVGEIVVRGPSVGDGYWRRSEESRSSFGQVVEGHGEGFLRTGDLGVFYEGELFVTGRLKDVVIIRGRNYYPQDIEQTVESSHPDVLPGAAFSCEIAGRERLIVVTQVDRSCVGEARQTVVEAIRRAVVSEHEIDPHAVVLIRQTSLPVTSSGKVQRGLCRQQYMAGELKTLHAWDAAVARQESGEPIPETPRLEGLSVEEASEQIEAWMFSWLDLRGEVEASEMDRLRPFAEMGLDSLTAVEMSGELEEAFSVPLPPVVAWNYPTPAALAQYLAEQSLGVEADSLEHESTNGAVEMDSLLSDIEGLSDEEAERLLSEE